MTTSDPGPTGPDFESFYRTSRDACLRTVLATTLDRANTEEYLAEAFTRALERWDTLRRHPTPQAWVVRTATNLHRDQHRRGRRLLRLLPQLAGPEQVPEDDVRIDGALWSALQELTPSQREVLALRVLLGLSAAETATTLGMSSSSVSTHLHRALTALRGCLALDGAAPGHNAPDGEPTSIPGRPCRPFPTLMEPLR
jgi:RNA polymerase sigma-70 factor (ECF subfamily)